MCLNVFISTYCQFLINFSAFANCSKANQWPKTGLNWQLGLWFFARRRRPTESDRTVVGGECGRHTVADLLHGRPSRSGQVWYDRSHTDRSEMERERFDAGCAALCCACDPWTWGGGGDVVWWYYWGLIELVNVFLFFWLLKVKVYEMMF